MASCPARAASRTWHLRPCRPVLHPTWAATASARPHRWRVMRSAPDRQKVPVLLGQLSSDPKSQRRSATVGEVCAARLVNAVAEDADALVAQHGDQPRQVVHLLVAAHAYAQRLQAAAPRTQLPQHPAAVGRDPATLGRPAQVLMCAGCAGQAACAGGRGTCLHAALESRPGGTAACRLQPTASRGCLDCAGPVRGREEAGEEARHQLHGLLLHDADAVRQRARPVQVARLGIPAPAGGGAWPGVHARQGWSGSCQRPC